MALELNDLMALRSMGEKDGMSPYEQVKLDYMAAKKPSGVAVAGLTVASVAAAAGITAWIFGGMQANAKGKEAKEAALAAKEIAIAKNDGLRELVTVMAQNLAAERAERINGQTTISHRSARPPLLIPPYRSRCTRHGTTPSAASQAPTRSP